MMTTRSEARRRTPPIVRSRARRPRKKRTPRAGGLHRGARHAMRPNAWTRPVDARDETQGAGGGGGGAGIHTHTYCWPAHLSSYRPCGYCTTVGFGNGGAAAAYSTLAVSETLVV